jgi:hypothetical protein
MTMSQKKTIIHTGTLLSTFVVFFFFLLLSTAHAEIAPYAPLVSIPGLTNQKMASLPDYLNKVYYLIITIGALYGVVKIAFAGVKYSLSDVITSKESAKEDIKGVLLGLAILLIPFIVLRTINPELTRLDVFSSAPKIKLESSGTTGNGSSSDSSASTTKSPFESSYSEGTAITSCNGTISYPNRTTGPGGIGGDDGDAVVDMSKCTASCTEKNGKFIQQGESGSSCVYDAKTAESGKRFTDTKCPPGEVLKTAGMLYKTYYCAKIPTN